MAAERQAEEEKVERGKKSLSNTHQSTDIISVTPRKRLEGRKSDHIQGNFFTTEQVIFSLNILDRYFPCQRKQPAPLVWVFAPGIFLLLFYEKAATPIALFPLLSPFIFRTGLFFGGDPKKAAFSSKKKSLVKRDEKKKKRS